MNSISALASGRITRTDMLVGALLMLAAALPLFVDLDVVTYYNDAETALGPKTYFFSIWAFALFMWSTILGIKRLHDIGMSGYFILISFIPYISLGLLVYLVVKKPQVGANQYGQQPVGLSWRRVFLLE